MVTGVSGTGPWPGVDVLQAQSTVVGDLADAPDGVQGMPFTTVLPARGPAATAVARTAGLLEDLPVELGVHGWKLADRPGRDLARVRSLQREDLDALAVAAHGYQGPLVVGVLGPLSLSAELYLARGDRVLADPGAVRDIADSLAVGLADHLKALVRAVPGAAVHLLVHEPQLAAVLAGALPTFSGHATLRSLPGPLAGERMQTVLEAARGAGAVHAAVHAGASWTGIAAVRAAGADGLALDVGAFDERGWERVAEAVESGARLWAQLPSQATSSCAGPDVVGQADRLTVPWRRVGLPASGLASTVLLAADPAPGAGPDDARSALAALVRTALLVAERAES
ncbi:hypothetical protein ACTHAM_001619 [Cellulomonas soli]|uniref:hypothetical protein n=1 Tax=Cellulomonas soli TaxID=931535 RepID=UPI003F8619C7